MIKRLVPFLLFSVPLTLLLSCNSPGVYESYSPVQRAGWHMDSIQTNLVSIEDSTANYNLYFNIRNSVDYPYSNLWLFVTIVAPGGDVRYDTVEVTLADPAGKWNGSGLGKLRDNQVEYLKNIYFPKKGEYRFTIGHGMRNELLKGISDIGIRIEQNK